MDLGFDVRSTDFPLIAEEALMIEPTETESKETICDAMIQIVDEAASAPETLWAVPVTTPVGRLEQTRAARQPDLRWRRSGGGRP